MYPVIDMAAIEGVLMYTFLRIISVRFNFTHAHLFLVLVKYLFLIQPISNIFAPYKLRAKVS